MKKNNRISESRSLKKLNSSIYINRGRDFVADFIRIHKLIKKEVDFNKKNKFLAVYLLLGGMISSLIRSLYALEEGNHEKHAELQRLISESMDVVLFFCVSNDDSSEIKQWFAGKLISISPKNKGNIPIDQRAKLFNTDVQTIKNMDDTVKIAKDVLSRYVHPSLELLTSTYDFKTNYFRYYTQRQIKFSDDELKSKSRLGIYPVVTAMGAALSSIFLRKTAKHIKKLAEITKEIYPESFSINQ